MGGGADGWIGLEPTYTHIHLKRTRQDIPSVERGRNKLLLALFVAPEEKQIHGPDLGHGVVLAKP